MTPPPLEFPAPAAEDLLGGDWFGEGSVFDTGEELAGALLVIAAGRSGGSLEALALPAPGVPPEARHDPADPRRATVGAAQGAAETGGFDGEFQVATMPSARSAEPSGWSVRPAAVVRRRWSGGTPGAERRGWSIRQSVQVLRLTEEILIRLREEAAQLTWQLAAAAHREAGD
ncbi:MAG: hypothetical protein ACLQT7_02415 [Candidatus Dormibacteria bacterium]